MVKLAPKGHIVAKMVSSNKYQLKQDTIESGPSSAAADTVSTAYSVNCIRSAAAVESLFIIIICHPISMLTNHFPTLLILSLFILSSIPVLL